MRERRYTDKALLLNKLNAVKPEIATFGLGSGSGIFSLRPVVISLYT